MQTILESVAGSRHLTVDDKEVALDLLESGLQEVPVYRWLLGEDAPPDAYRWLGELLFEENIHGLYGVFESDELIALAAVTDPESPPAAGSEQLKERTRHYVRSLDGFVDRYREFRQACADATVPDAIDILLVLVHPDHRRRGVNDQFAGPALEEARRRGVPVTTSTSYPYMSAYYLKYNAPVHAEYTLTDGPTVWVHRWDPPSPSTVG